MGRLRFEQQSCVGGNPFREKKEREGGKGKMKTYRIMNKQTMGWWEGKSPSAKKACEKAGWYIDECWIREKTHTGAGGWKKVKEEVKEK